MQRGGLIALAGWGWLACAGEPATPEPPAPAPAPEPEPVAAPAPPPVEAPQPAVKGKVARCVISSVDDRYEGPCDFLLGQGGSFSVSRVASEEPLFGLVTVLSVSLVGEGQAEVRGLTTSGINSRWGEAQRSAEDGACWVGTDFEICAY